MPSVVSIWIEPGCIQCAWCNDLAPEVFAVGVESSLIRGDARDDGITDRNPARVALCEPITGAKADFVEFITAGCPVRVIHFVAEPGPDD